MNNRHTTKNKKISSNQNLLLMMKNNLVRCNLHFFFSVWKNRDHLEQLESRICEKICYPVLLWAITKTKVWSVSKTDTTCQSSDHIDWIDVIHSDSNLWKYNLNCLPISSSVNLGFCLLWRCLGDMSLLVHQHASCVQTIWVS